LRAYWRQHKANHEGEDTDQYEVAARIATGIFNLYWDKPNYAGLRAEKKEILNYFIKHIQLSKSREGQSTTNFARNSNSGLTSESDSHAPSSRKRTHDLSTSTRIDNDPTRHRSESIPSLRSPDLLRSIREIIPDQQVPCSLLLDGVPAQVPEFAVRSEVVQTLQNQFGVKCIVSTINVGSPVYHILLASVEECDALAGQAIRLSFCHAPLVLYRLPFSLSTPTVVVPQSKKRRGAELDVDDTLAAKKPKLAGHESANVSNVGVPPSVLHPFEMLAGGLSNPLLTHQASALLRQNPMLIAPNLNQEDHFVVERVLHQRWVQNKVQYLLQLKGETSTIKVWMFDEDIFNELDANRKQANLFNANQTGIFPSDPSQLPEIEQILGAKMVGSQLMFYVKWAGSSVFSMIPSMLVNKISPTKVIQFYEARLSFEPASISDLSSPHMVSSPSSSETTSVPAIKDKKASNTPNPLSHSSPLVPTPVAL